ncbi:hypothetical protein ACFP3I_03470 [Chryseobacterium arachidis]
MIQHIEFFRDRRWVLEVHSVVDMDSLLHFISLRITAISQNLLGLR